MELKDVLKYIRSKIKEESKELSLGFDDSNIGKMFYPLLFNMAARPFVIKDCTVAPNPSEEDPTELTVSGKATLLPSQKTRGKNSPLSNDMPVTLYLTFRDKNPDILYYELRVVAQGNYGLEDLFGQLPPQYRSEKGYLELHPSLLSSLGIKNPTFQTTLDNAHAERPFAVNGMLTVLPSKILVGTNTPADTTTAGWEKYAFLLSSGASELLDINLPISGFASLRHSFGGYAQFTLMSELSYKFDLLPAQEEASEAFFKQAGLRLYLESGTPNQNVFNDIAPVISTTGLGIFFEFKNLSPIEFSTPLFINDNIWRLKVSFATGLGAIDILNFFGSLFQLGSGKSDLLIPADCALNNLKLYELQFVMEKENPENWSLQLRDAAAWLHTAKPWKLPLDFITLDDLNMLWHIQWGKKKENEKRDHFFTGEIAATITIDLPSGMKINMYAKAALPQLDIEASLKLEQDENKKDLKSIMKDAASNLPSTSNNPPLLLAQLDVMASYQQRSLTVYAQVNDALSFYLGNVEIKLEKIYAEASFTQQGNAYMLGGVITMETEINNPAKSFSISLEGRYANKTWSFHGWLSAGRVDLVGLIAAFLKVDPKGLTLPDVNINEFDVLYNYDSLSKESDFSITIAVAVDLSALFPSGFPVKLNGRLRLKKNNKEINYISALVALDISPLVISVQADNFHKKDEAVYLFMLRYQQTVLRASYSTKKVDGDICKILNISMQNLTLGDIVSWIVSLVDPNARHELPAPWNILDKIDLSKFNLEINITKNIVTFSYDLDLDILGIAKIKSIGARYTKDTGKMVLVVSASTVQLGPSGAPGQKTKEYSWDPISESPPDIAKNPQKFKLLYLGIGQHYTTENVKTANSIGEAIKALKEQFKSVPTDKGVSKPDEKGKILAKYDSETNWTFGIDCVFNEALHIVVVLNDPHLYGILITVESNNVPFKDFNGLMLELLYKKITKDIGMFKATLQVPERMRKIDLGTLQVSIGIMSIEIYTNGNFLLDLGFPHNRDFSRSFGLQYALFSGKGGLYFGILCGVTCPKLPVPKSGAFTSVLSLGLGLSIGIGRSFNFGIVKGGFSLELTGIFEGLFAVYDSGSEKVSYFRVSATVGITGRFFIKVDLFIISLEASAEISAFAMLVMESYKPTLVDLNLRLALSARVKIIFFTIEVSYNFSHDFHFTLGEASLAPWDRAIPQGRSRKAIKYFDDQRLNEISEMSLSITPLFSLSDATDATGNQKMCVAFIPSIDKTDCIKLVDLFSHWVLTNFEDAHYLKCPRNLSPESMKRDVSYEQLSSFLANNAKFTIRNAQENSKNNDDNTGYAFPMPPPVSLSFSVIKDVNAETIDVPKDATKDATKDETIVVTTDDINIEDAPKTLLEVAYDNENQVSDSYVERLRDYFARFDSLADDPSPASNDEDKQPISQIIFLDYAHMLLRGLIQQAMGMYEVCQVPAEDFDCADTMKTFGIPLEQILTDNMNAVLCPQTLTLSKTVSVGKGDTLDSLAKGLHSESKPPLPGTQSPSETSSPSEGDSSPLRIEPKALFEWNKNILSLLRPGSKIELLRTTFENKNNLPRQTVAALFFVRHGGFTKEIHYHKYVENIFTQVTDKIKSGLSETNNDGPSDISRKMDNAMAWEFTNPPVIEIKLPLPSGTQTWLTLAGDTVENLARLCTILAGELDADDNEAWEKYLKTFQELNTNAESASFQIPNWQFTLSGAGTLASLYRQLYASNIEEDDKVKLLLNKAIFRQNAALIAKTVPCEIKEDLPLSVADALRTFNLSIKELASALSKAGDSKTTVDVGKGDKKFRSGSNISVYSAKTIPKEMVLKVMNNEENAHSLCSTASRFLLQGLRVPPEQEESVQSTIALYKKLKQQVDFDLNAGSLWNLKLGTSGNTTWMAGENILELKKEDIEPHLPDTDFTFKTHYQTPKDLALFTKQARAYSLESGFLWAEKKKDSNAVVTKWALHPFSRALKQDWEYVTAPIFKTRKSTLSTFKSENNGILLTLSVSKQDGILSIYGAGPEERLVLEVIAKLDMENVLFEHTLFYKPSDLDNLPNTLIEITPDTKSKLVRTNLSRETRMFARNARSRVKDVATPCVATYGRKNFLRLLWECSTVGGGGYHLYLPNPPESNIYDKDGNATLWLFIRQNGAHIRPEYINCALSQETSLVQESVPIYVMQEEKDANKLLLEDKPTLPPGSYGISLQCNKPKEGLTESNNQENTKALFSILGYRIGGDNYKNFSNNDSRPLLPRDEKGKENESLQQYDIIVPLYKMLDENTNNPYAAIGKPANIKVYCRDVLGNNAIGEHKVTITPSINDLMIGLNEWPGLSLSYEVLGEAQPKLVFHLEPQNQYKDKKKQAKAAERLHLSLLQLAGDAKMTLSSSLFEDIQFSSAQKQEIIGLGSGIYKRMTEKENNESPCAPLRLEFTPKLKDKLSNSFLLTFTFGLTREGENKLPETALCAKSLLEPRVLAKEKEDGKSQDGDQSLKAFASKLEKAFPEFKLAHKGNVGSELYVVKVGDGTMIPELTIAPYKYKEGVTAPIFYALSPLSNKPISREVFVAGYTKEWDEEETQIKQQFTNIDLDVWAYRFLGDLERCLEAKFTEHLTSFDDESINLLLGAKEKLAEKMSLCLIPVQKENGLDSTSNEEEKKRALEEEKKRVAAARNIVKDRLRQNLVEGCNISSIAAYNLTAKKTNVRLATVLSIEKGHEPTLGATSAKLDLRGAQGTALKSEHGGENGLPINPGHSGDKETCAECKKLSFPALIVLESKSPYMAGAKIDLSLSVQDVEYNIKAKNDGYESSEWLRLVIPLTAPNNLLTIDFTSGLLAPNPLRSLPSPLVLEGQQCLPQKEYLCRWQHEVSAMGKAIEQDSHTFSIVYSQVKARSRRAAFKDLFDILCQYASIRDKILPAIFDKHNAAAFSAFVSLANEIASSWKIQPSQNRQASIMQTGQLDCTLCYEAKGAQGMKIIKLTDGYEGVQVKTTTPQEMLKLGDKINFSLYVSKLSIYNQNLAKTSVVTTRNANLLLFASESERTSIDVADNFIYQTEQKGLTPLYASIRTTVKEPIDHIIGEITKKTLLPALKKLSELLEIKNQNNTASLTVWYEYTMPTSDLQRKPSVRLPVSFFPQFFLDNLCKEEIVNSICDWFTQEQPTQDKFSLQFDLVVYSGKNKVLMSLEKLCVMCSLK